MGQLTPIEQMGQLLELLEKNELNWEVQTKINGNLQEQVTKLKEAILLQNIVLVTLNNKEYNLQDMNTTNIPEDVQEILRTME